MAAAGTTSESPIRDSSLVSPSPHKAGKSQTHARRDLNFCKVTGEKEAANTGKAGGAPKLG